MRLSSDNRLAAADDRLSLQFLPIFLYRPLHEVDNSNHHFPDEEQDCLHEGMVELLAGLRIQNMNILEFELLCKGRSTNGVDSSEDEQKGNEHEDFVHVVAEM